MKKFIFAFALSILAGVGLSWSGEGHSGAKHGVGGKELVVKGELVDMACYMAHEGKGKKHAECARMCVLKNGTPLGLLTSDGKVYLLIEDHSGAKTRKPYAQAKELVSETVTITGESHTRGGVQAIVVKAVAKE